MKKTKTHITVPSFTAPLAKAVKEKGHTLYLVGGYVRNSLLFLPVSDIDLCSSMPPEEMIPLLKTLQLPFDQRDMRLGTLGIQMQQFLEYTCFRTESYAAGGVHLPEKVAFTTEMDQDARRRDFKINAIYADALTGEIVDPLNAIEDLQNKRLSACKENPTEMIEDDGLRILRMVRFACQLGFEIEQALFLAAKEHIVNLKDIANERKKQEFEKILLADIAYPSLELFTAHARGLILLDALNAFADLLPELQEGVGVVQDPAYHKFDVYWHNIHSCAASVPEIELRLAALLHDIGKPAVQKATGKMYGHEIAGSSIAKKALERLCFGRKTITTVCLLIERHMFDLDGKAKVSTVKKRFTSWGFGFSQQLIDLRRADIYGSGAEYHVPQVPEKWQAILQELKDTGAIDQINQLAISGHDIMQHTGLAAGKKIGKIKQMLFEQVALDPARNQKETLIQQAKSLAKSIE